MVAMVARIEFLLKEADKSKASLTYVVFVPTFDGSGDTTLVEQMTSASFQALVSLSRMHIVLKSREHVYAEGAKHIRPQRHKQIENETSVLLLQSKASVALGIHDDCIRDVLTKQHENERDHRKKR